jgi:hypothetical protein
MIAVHACVFVVVRVNTSDLQRLFTSLVSVKLYEGHKIELPDMYEVSWKHLSTDILAMARSAEGLSCNTIDECVDHVADEISLRLGIKVSTDVLMSNMAHLCPHVLLPGLPLAYIVLLSNRMSEVMGHHAAKWLRSTLVRDFLRIAGPAADMCHADLLQELVLGE